MKIKRAPLPLPHRIARGIGYFVGLIIAILLLWLCVMFIGTVALGSTWLVMTLVAAVF